MRIAHSVADSTRVRVKPFDRPRSRYIVLREYPFRSRSRCSFEPAILPPLLAVVILLRVRFREHYKRQTYRGELAVTFLTPSLIKRYTIVCVCVCDARRFYFERILVRALILVIVVVT